MSLIEYLDNLLKCLGPCRKLTLNELIHWEYTIGTAFPLPSDLANDRLYVYAKLTGEQIRPASRRGFFRFSIYGGIGSTGYLITEDLRLAIANCSGCRIREWNIDVTSVPFPQRNSDRQITVTSLTFAATL